MPQIIAPKSRTRILRKVVWTNHAQGKMRHYGLSEARVRRVIHSPARIEEGIAENTFAMMQRTGPAPKGHEIWVMFQDKGSERRIVSAWRYPGQSKTRGPLPAEIIKEIRSGLMGA